ncbi:MAG: hypothetical protein ABIQ52_12605 [Vicinamibacterales bacterium]
MKSNLPIACTLTPDEMRRGRTALLPGLFARAEFHEALADGVRLRFRSEAGVIPRIAAVIEAERQCCRFLHFQLTADPDGGPVSLEVTGPPGTADFLAAWVPAP